MYYWLVFWAELLLFFWYCHKKVNENLCHKEYNSKDVYKTI